jgi:pyruvate dehydrogenase E2 component (dihydrolipoamide acetyltransferase)
MANRIQAFTMPKWGIEMEEGVIRQWHADEGQTVRQGELLAVIETDKIANEVELEFTGLLRKRLAFEGDAYPVGALLAVFAESDVPDTEIEAFVMGFKPADASFAHKDDAPPTGPGATPPRAVMPEGLSISPKAMELAATLGVDLTRVAGSGRDGRISLQDIEQAAEAQGLGAAKAPEDDANPYHVIKLSAMRRTIARRIAEAARTIPHFYLRTDITLDALIAQRARTKAEKGDAPSINDYLIKACAAALMEVPEVNVHYADDEIHQFQHADISVAVAVPGGLVTPVVRHAELKSIEAIATAMRDLVERAKAERLAQHEYRGGTFSLSNLGMYGVTSFDAVINPPMAAILAAGAIRRVVVERNGVAAFSAAMQVTLSCDHRAIDGALGGRFLQALKSALETPEKL